MKILCFGDSLTAGYTSGEYFPYANYLSVMLEADCTDVRVEHIGLCGWGTSEMLHNKDQEVCYDCFRNEWKGLQRQLDCDGEAEPYEYIFILAGTNDLDDTTVETILQNLEEIASICLSRAKRVGILNIPGIGVEHEDVDLLEARTAVNEGLHRLVSASRGFFLVDSARALPNDRSKPLPSEIEELWDRDMLHLSSKGSQTLAELVFESIKSNPLS